MKIKTYFLLTLLLMATVAFGSVKPIPVTAATIEWKAYKIAYERWGTIELESGELDFEEGTLTGGNFVVDMSTTKFPPVSVPSSKSSSPLSSSIVPQRS